MKFCDSVRHVDIAYDGSRRDGCPLCEAIEEIDALNEELEKVQEA